MPAHLPSVLAANALNRLLAREPWACERLAPHAGKSVRLALDQRHITLAIQSGGRLQPCDPAIVPDVSVRLPAGQLGRLPEALRRKDAAALTALLHLEGDAGLAQVVSGLAQDLRWDVEHELAERFGDIAALRLMQGAAALRRGVQRTRGQLAANLAEYLAHESGMMLSRPGFAGWRTGLQEAGARLDALEERLARLDAAKAGHA